MSAMVQLLRVHEPDAVREILEQAIGIANDLPGAHEWRELYFTKAVDLLAARLPIMPQQINDHIDLSKLRLPG